MVPYGTVLVNPIVERLIMPSVSVKVLTRSEDGEIDGFTLSDTDLSDDDIRQAIRSFEVSHPQLRIVYVYKAHEVTV